MQRDELTREEAIRRHRTMWNWLADQAEATGQLFSKIHVFSALWPDEDWRAHVSMCWACEIHGGSCRDGTECVLVWPHGRCTPFAGEGEGYLYSDWSFAHFMGDKKEYIRLAREIANLPEREVTGK